MESRFFHKLLMILDDTFPNKVPPDLFITERQVSYLQGQQSIIDFIRQLQEEENGWNLISS